MSEGERITLDANRLIRAVLGRRVRQVITEYASVASYFAPDVAYDDARNWLPTILEKRGSSSTQAEALAFLDELESIVSPVPADIYVPFRDDALARIGQRDPDDWPILAAALALKTPIWTEDNDFFGTGVPTWTTDRVHLYLGRPK